MFLCFCRIFLVCRIPECCTIVIPQQVMLILNMSSVQCPDSDVVTCWQLQCAVSGSVSVTMFMMSHDVWCLHWPTADRPQVIIHLPTVFRFVSMWNLMSSHLHQLSVLFCQSMSNLPRPLLDAQKPETRHSAKCKIRILTFTYTVVSDILFTVDIPIFYFIADKPQTLNNVWRGILLVLLCDTCCTFDHYFKVRIIQH